MAWYDFLRKPANIAGSVTGLGGVVQGAREMNNGNVWGGLGHLGAGLGTGALTFLPGGALLKGGKYTYQALRGAGAGRTVAGAQGLRSGLETGIRNLPLNAPLKHFGVGAGVQVGFNPSLLFGKTATPVPGAPVAATTYADLQSNQAINIMNGRTPEGIKLFPGGYDGSKHPVAGSSYLGGATPGTLPTPPLAPLSPEEQRGLIMQRSAVNAEYENMLAQLKYEDANGILGANNNALDIANASRGNSLDASSSLAQAGLDTSPGIAGGWQESIAQRAKSQNIDNISALTQLLAQSKFSRNSAKASKMSQLAQIQSNAVEAQKANTYNQIMYPQYLGGN